MRGTAVSPGSGHALGMLSVRCYSRGWWASPGGGAALVRGDALSGQNTFPQPSRDM